ncbi:MAG: patatin-like phospholipase family protein [Steroidobacteraceae bacterium]
MPTLTAPGTVDHGLTGLVLSGGGARAAYQVGVLKAIAEMLPVEAPTPFPIVSGTSAGAINVTELGIHADRFRVAVANLEQVWSHFHIEQVFKADSISMIRAGTHWLFAMASGGWLLPPPKALLDNSPLRSLLSRSYDFAGIGKSIAAGHLKAIAISASGYSSARSVAFFEARSEVGSWARVQRAGQPCTLTLDHLMASVAIPFLFPPVFMSNEYYGDGSMRQATPFSAAIHLGADRLMVVGTRSGVPRQAPTMPISPTFGQIFGYMLDALFTDGLYTDMERLVQINHMIEQLEERGGPEARSARGLAMRRVGMMVILPSRDPAEIARAHVSSLPRTLRVLLRSMGAMNASGGQLMSYLMFEASYTRELISLGYEDAMGKRHQIQAFLKGDESLPTGATTILRRLAGVVASGEEQGTESE